MIDANKNWKEAKIEIDKAYAKLGKQYYEDNKENSEDTYSQFFEEIETMYKKELLWHQYGLKMEGKLFCEKCGAIIPYDSVFCNKCAAKVPEYDYTEILDNRVDVDNTAIQENAPVTYSFNTMENVIPKEKKCPECGQILPPNAVFCEHCGTRLYM